jgi:hypothetical protein
MEVQNAAAMMRQDDKDVQEVKVEGGNDEEVGIARAFGSSGDGKVVLAIPAGKPSPRTPST